MSYQGIKHFKFDVVCRDLTVYTDHKPLTSALAKSEKVTNERQARQLDFISQYTRDIRHVAGEDNQVADTLSRVDSVAPLATVDSATLAAAQREDLEVRRIINGDEESSLKLQQHPDAFGVSLTCDTSTGRRRPFVPQSLRPNNIAQLHNQSHPGVAATIRLVKDNFAWPSMDKDIKTFVRECIPCQRSKVHRHTIRSRP